MPDEAPAAPAPETAAPTSEATATPEAPPQQPEGAQPEQPAQPDGQQQPDGQPEGQQTGEPEALTLTPPEGMEEQFGERFQEFASGMDSWLKDNPDATAQEALQEAANRQAQSVQEQQQQQQQAFETQVSEWEQTARSDKEIGGEKFDENVAVAAKALDTFGSPELREVLNTSGLGSHPEMIRFAVKAGQAIKEPGVVTGATSSQPRNFAKSIYPDK